MSESADPGLALVEIAAVVGDAVKRAFPVRTPTGEVPDMAGVTVTVVVADPLTQAELHKADNAGLGGVTVDPTTGLSAWTWAVPANTPPGWYSVRLRLTATGQSRTAARGTLILRPGAGHG